MYEGCESEVDERGNRGTSHACNGDIVILEVLQRGMRARRGVGARVVAANNGILRDHPARTRRENGTR